MSCPEKNRDQCILFPWIQYNDHILPTLITIPKFVTVFSFDYDNHANILSKEGAEKGYFEEARRNYKIEIDAAIRSMRTAFKVAIIRPELSEETNILMIGSGRQSPLQDDANAALLKNGKCFPFYEQFAKRNNWIFNKFLLLDVYNSEGILRENPLSIGTTFDRTYDIKCKESLKAHKYTKLQKHIMIEEQMKIAVQLYPRYNINFIHSNDDLQELKDIADYFDPQKHPTHLPRRVGLKLIHYSWVEMYSDYLTTLSETNGRLASESDLLKQATESIRTIALYEPKDEFIVPVGRPTQHKRNYQNTLSHTPSIFFSNKQTKTEHIELSKAEVLVQDDTSNNIVSFSSTMK